MQNEYAYIAVISGKGRGVFARTAIPANTVIEIAPVIVMSKNDRSHLDKTLLHDYIFEWGADNDQCGMALGFIPIYNHSYKSNCEYFMEFAAECIFVKTVVAVAKDEELTINYNGDWDNQQQVWFNTV